MLVYNKIIKNNTQEGGKMTEMQRIQERVNELNNRFPNAFKAKYPDGTLEKGDYKGYSYKVTFTPGGKTYIYRGGSRDIAKKLGLDIDWAA